MDVIDASHFENVKKFLTERPWWSMKLSRESGVWMLFLINQNDLGPFSVMPFMDVSFGAALKNASTWVNEQYVIQEVEATTPE